jgi:hypothetical protein
MNLDGNYGWFNAAKRERAFADCKWGFWKERLLTAELIYMNCK